MKPIKVKRITGFFHKSNWSTSWSITGQKITIFPFRNGNSSENFTLRGIEESRNGNLTFFEDRGRQSLFLGVLREFRGVCAHYFHLFKFIQLCKKNPYLLFHWLEIERPTWKVLHERLFKGEGLLWVPMLIDWSHVD